MIAPRSLLFRRVFACAAACALFLAGCVTDDQVKSIVRDSNYQMLLASSPGLETTLAPDPEKVGSTADNDAAARTNAFLAAHPDDPAMVNALRLRQTLLYLAQRSFALADVTRKQITLDALHSTRDKALAGALDDLSWWAKFSLTGEFEFSSNHAEAAAQHIASLQAKAAGKDLAASPDLRDYFMEMSAWIGIKLGLATPRNAPLKKERVQKAVDAWTSTFSTQELELIASGDFKEVKPTDLSTRRVIRARSMLTTLAERTRGAPNTDFVFGQQGVNKFYAQLAH
jgi:hypothetical protein